MKVRPSVKPMCEKCEDHPPARQGDGHLHKPETQAKARLKSLARAAEAGLFPTARLYT